MSNIGKHISEWFDAVLVGIASVFTGISRAVRARYEMTLVRIRIVN